MQFINMHLSPVQVQGPIPSHSPDHVNAAQVRNYLSEFIALWTFWNAVDTAVHIGGQFVLDGPVVNKKLPTQFINRFTICEYRLSGLVFDTSEHLRECWGEQ